jgi:DNA-directed RNA polymerase subunit RPC12/RpoP
MPKISGYNTLLGIHCPACTDKLGLDKDKPIFAGTTVEVIPACAECGDDLEDLEEIEEDEDD